MYMLLLLISIFHLLKAGGITTQIYLALGHGRHCLHLESLIVFGLVGTAYTYHYMLPSTYKVDLAKMLPSLAP